MNNTQDAFIMLDQNRPVEIVYTIYENNTITGWCITMQEAEEICHNNPMLQWGKKKKSNIPSGCLELVASVLSVEFKK